VLKDGVVTAVEGGCADVEALLVGDFVGSNQTGRVASSGGRNRRIEGMSKGVSERDAWGAVSTESGEAEPSNMRDWVATLRSHSTRTEKREQKGRKENGPVVDRSA
jgi:hypothetical protein